LEEIAKKFRELRNAQNLTLKELSEKTGLSISFLSQVERGTSSLAITSLKRISDAFNVPITYFFESINNPTYHVKIKDYQPFRIEGRSAEYCRLSGEFPGRTLEPLFVVLDPGYNQTQVFNHPGEEFYYVLEGAVVFTVDGKEFLVKAGESIHYPSNLPHVISNPLQKKSTFINILTPVLF